MRSPAIAAPIYATASPIPNSEVKKFVYFPVTVIESKIDCTNTL